MLWRHFQIRQPRTDVEGLAAHCALTIQPSPSHGPITISLALEPHERGTLAVYDVRGRLVRSLRDSRLAVPGSEVSWDGRDGQGRPVESGVYLVCLIAGPRTTAQRIVIVR